MELIGLFSFVGQQLPIDFCTNNEKEPVSLLSSTPLHLFMVHRHQASEMNLILTDKITKSDRELFWSIFKDTFFKFSLTMVKVIMTKFVR